MCGDACGMLAYGSELNDICQCGPYSAESISKGLELFFFFFQAEAGIRDLAVTGVQTCALPILIGAGLPQAGAHPLRRTIGGARRSRRTDRPERVRRSRAVARRVELDRAGDALVPVSSGDRKSVV